MHNAVHTGEKEYECDICNKCFQQKHNLATHILRIHLKDKPFLCSDCGSKFGYASHFKRHMKIHFLKDLKAGKDVKHLVLNPYTCPQCFKSFETRYLLKTHQIVHTDEKPFECAQCGQRFVSKRGIYEHMRRKHEMVPREVDGKDMVVCSFCGKYVTRKGLSKHMNRHTRKRQYLCNYCGKVFLENCQRTVHERIHHNKKPYICDLCGKGHSQIGNLRLHLKRKHNQNRIKRKPIEKPKQQNSIELITNNEVVDNLKQRHNTQQIGWTGNETINQFVEIQRRVTNEKPKVQMELPFQIHTQAANNELMITNAVQRINEEETAQKENVESQQLIEWSENESSDESAPSQITKAMKPKENKKVWTGNETIDEFVEIANRWMVDKVEEKSTKDIESPPSSPNEEQVIDVDLSNEAAVKEAAIKNLKDKINEEVLDKIVEECRAAGFGKKAEKFLKKARAKKTKRTPLTFFLKLLSPYIDKLSIIKKTKKGLEWQCWSCKTVLKNQYLFLRHRIVHEDPENLPHQCQICLKRFSQSDSLNVHMLVHQEKYLFYCHVCGASFRHRGHLNTHLQRHETPSKTTFTCDFCQKTFPNKTRMEEHIRTHTKEKPFLCKECGVLFGCRSTYNRHLKCHSEERPYQCHMCALTFKDVSNLKRHLGTHTRTNKVTCTCGREYTQSSSLNRHRKVCQGLSPPTYTCPMCSKMFHTMTDYSRHMLTHDQVLRFECTYCGKLLKTKLILKRHIRKRHSDVQA